MLKQRARLDAQRSKTSGLNPNPLEPARSKHDPLLSRKSQNIIENVSIVSAHFSCVGHVFHTFFLKVAPVWAPGSSPKVLKRCENSAQGCPDGAQRRFNGFSKCQKNTKMNAESTQIEPNGVKMERNVPKPLTRHPEAPTKYIKTQKCDLCFLL